MTVVFDADTVSAAATAAAIADALPPQQYRIATVDSKNLTAPVPRSQPAVVIAVGRAAVDAARARLPGRPIVFCQVFAYEDVLKDGGAIWGVHSQPPFELQLKTWQAIDPTLRGIALILGEGRSVLSAEITKAAASVGTDVRFETSHSDRETFYLFKRLAAQVDGLWLFPDNRVLSPTVLRELLSYANSHNVGVFAFNESLLRWGALASAASVPADIAETVRLVAERVAEGKTQDLPAMTPLRAAELHVNPAVAAALGLPHVVEQHWVARDPD
ncbi:MAG: ABC transporter substrate binding protein [Gammaproteobacteria bacterium]